MEIKNLAMWSRDFHSLLKTVYRKEPRKPVSASSPGPGSPGEGLQSRGAVPTQLWLPGAQAAPRTRERCHLLIREV